MVTRTPINRARLYMATGDVRALGDALTEAYHIIKHAPERVALLDRCMNQAREALARLNAEAEALHLTPVVPMLPPLKSVPAPIAEAARFDNVRPLNRVAEALHGGGHAPDAA